MRKQPSHNTPPCKQRIPGAVHTPMCILAIIPVDTVGTHEHTPPHAVIDSPEIIALLAYHQAFNSTSVEGTLCPAVATYAA